MSERSILCFGDSNTWGFVPMERPDQQDFHRYGATVRWTRALERRLGTGFRVQEYAICGLAGAMASGEERFFDGNSRAAIDHVRGAVAAHWPLDAWVVMLGTNDVAHPSLPALQAIAAGISATVKAGLATCETYGGPSPRVLLVSPIPLGPTIIGVMDAAPVIERSRALGPALESEARRNDWRFVDAARAGAIDVGDGVHWSAAQHLRFAELMAAELQALFSQPS